MNMRVLGIDPGIATTGFGVIDKTGNRFVPVKYGPVLTKAHTPLPERLNILYAAIRDIIKEYEPEHMAVEELFFNTNVSTALIVGQARGVILLAAERAGIPVFGYTPLQIKSAVCGYGKADKKQVQYMVSHFLKLDKVPRPDDVADAIAVAICHFNSVRLKTIANKQYKF